MKLTSVSLALVFIALSIASLASAHTGAKGVTKERMDLMKDMADAMKAMGAMFKGEATFNPTVIADKAAFLAKHALTIPKLTPENSHDHPSEALPVIWEAWDDYTADAQALATEGLKLAELAKRQTDQVAIGEQYLRLGRTCGTCHDRFRKPKG